MKKAVPQHIAIIMDGNRRWAKNLGLPTKKGHEAGADALEVLLKAAGEFGIKYVTVFALSTENLKERSRVEVALLFVLLEKVLKEKVKILDESGIHLKFIGDFADLPLGIQKSLQVAEGKLGENNKLFLTVAFNYGGRVEVVTAVNKWADKKEEKITENTLNRYLYAPDLPDPDLIIRTGGAQRLSNFLLWQSAYSELYFTDTLWPDFDKKALEKTLKDYNQRKRNFGK